MSIQLHDRIRDAWDLPDHAEIAVHTALDQNKLDALELAGSDTMVAIHGAFDDLSALSNRSQIERLYISSLSLRSLDSLEGLPRLKALYLDNCREKPMNINALERFEELVDLRMEHCYGITELDCLSTLIRLVRLFLHGPRAKSIEPLAQLHQLEHLVIDVPNSVSDLSPVAALPKLRHLELTSLGGLLELSSLGPMTQLETLVFPGGQLRPEIEFVASLTGLKHLRRWGATALDLRPLHDLPHLVRLELVDCGMLHHFPFHMAPQFRELDLSESTIVGIPHEALDTSPPDDIPTREYIEYLQNQSKLTANALRTYIETHGVPGIEQHAPPIAPIFKPSVRLDPSLPDPEGDASIIIDRIVSQWPIFDHPGDVPLPEGTNVVRTAFQRHMVSKIDKYNIVPLEEFVEKCKKIGKIPNTYVPTKDDISVYEFAMKAQDWNGICAIFERLSGRPRKQSAIGAEELAWQFAEQLKGGGQSRWDDSMMVTYSLTWLFGELAGAGECDEFAELTYQILRAGAIPLSVCVEEEPYELPSVVAYTAQMAKPVMSAYWVFEEPPKFGKIPPCLV